MADTIISNTPGSREDSGTAGLLIAFVIIVAVAVGAFAMYQNGFFRSGTEADSTTNINVTLPDPVLPPVTAE
jgi:hypothetical protein